MFNRVEEAGKERRRGARTKQQQDSKTHFFDSHLTPAWLPCCFPGSKQRRSKLESWHTVQQAKFDSSPTNKQSASSPRQLLRLDIVNLLGSRHRDSIEELPTRPLPRRPINDTENPFDARPNVDGSLLESSSGSTNVALRPPKSALFRPRKGRKETPHVGGDQSRVNGEGDESFRSVFLVESLDKVVDGRFRHSAALSAHQYLQQKLGAKERTRPRR